MYKRQDKGQRQKVGALRPLLAPDGKARFSYTRNVYLHYALRDAGAFVGTDPEKQDPRFRWLPMKMVKRTSETPLYVEEYEYSPMNDGEFWGPNGASDFLTQRHGGKATVAFFDAHVAPVWSKRLNLPSSVLAATLAPGYKAP